jgi:uncharacterized protein (UPF0332 family)
MKADYPRTEWNRAIDALRDADLLLANGGFDGAASRAYYAAFHAVTALFALDGRIFTKHAGLEAAVHRDLVKDGKWPSELGRDFSFCVELRGVGDYGTEVRVDAKQATDAIASARRILVAVRDALPMNFPPVLPVARSRP